MPSAYIEIAVKCANPFSAAAPPFAIALGAYVPLRRAIEYQPRPLFLDVTINALTLSGLDQTEAAISEAFWWIQAS